MLNLLLIACTICSHSPQTTPQQETLLISQQLLTESQVVSPQTSTNSSQSITVNTTPVNSTNTNQPIPTTVNNEGKRQEAGGRRQESHPQGVGLEPAPKNFNRPQGAGLETLLTPVNQFPQSINWELSETLKNDSNSQPNWNSFSQLQDFNFSATEQLELDIKKCFLQNCNQNPQWRFQNPTEFRVPLPDKPEVTPKVPTEQEGKNSFKMLMETTIDLNAEKYPFIVNPSDNLLIKPPDYRPAKSNLYTNFNISVEEGIIKDRQSGQNFSGIPKANISYYPQDDQFFWILDNNTVVIETKGFHFGYFYQGRSVVSDYQQLGNSSIRLWGLQTAWAFPPQLLDLVGKENTRFTTVALEVTGSPGSNLQNSNFLFNSSWVPGSSLILFDNPNYGTTYSPWGGGALFENLEADNSPSFLQGFPTVNLQGLLANGRKFQAGEIIPEENLQKIGLNWGNFFTGAGYNFSPITTSQPGLKSERYPRLTSLRDDFLANKDILTILSNPYLTPDEKSWHYLNSLWWVSLGQGQASVTSTLTHRQVEDWNRLTMSNSHSRTQMQYDPKEIKMTYTNVFSNPGVSLTYTDLFKVDSNQTITANIGLLIGSVFKLVDQNNLNQNLQEAKKRFEQLKSISSLQTQATPEQRSQMNRRLNNTLADTNQNTSLHQVSGSWTFSGNITPNSSQLWQLKTGLYRRGVQFFEQKPGDWSPESPVFISSLRSPDFGPLTYKGYNLPVDATRITPEPSNHFFNVYNIMTTPEGTSYVQELKSFQRPVMTTVPFPDARRAADMEFGLIQLTRYSSRSIRENFYSGDIYLPSVELSLVGSRNNFNYTLALGSWFNPSPDSAPGVEKNNSQIPGVLYEPTIGFYLLGEMKWTFDNLIVAKDKKYYQFIRHIPSLRGNWNSSANSLNIVNLTSSYTFIMQNPNFNLVESVFLSYNPQGLNPSNQREWVAANIGRFQFNNGIKFDYSIELDQQTFINTSLTFPIINNPNFGNLSIGAYYRNYTLALQGINTRISTDAFGGVLEYLEPTTNSYINLNLGTNGQGLEAIANIGVRLKF